MIISRLYCGLGNQMFQYAAGLSLAYLRQTVLKLDVSWFSDTKAKSPHERYGLDCFNVTQQFATAEELNFHRGLQRNGSEDRFYRLLKHLGLKRYGDLLPLGGHWYMRQGFDFDPAFHYLPEGSLIDGGFQSEKYFEPVSNLLRKQFSFRYPPTPKVSAMADHIRSVNSVAVHFRRGDLATHPDYQRKISTLDASYYQGALYVLRRRTTDTHFFIFSDDLDFARQCGYFPKGSIFVDCVEDWNSYDDLRLMSLCSHFIIANSTFSWWGAWLSESAGKLVLYPDPWFANMPEHNEKDLCPPSWHPIPRHGHRG